DYPELPDKVSQADLKAVYRPKTGLNVRVGSDQHCRRPLPEDESDRTVELPLNTRVFLSQNADQTDAGSCGTLTLRLFFKTEILRGGAISTISPSIATINFSDLDSIRT